MVNSNYIEIYVKSCYYNIETDKKHPPPSTLVYHQPNSMVKYCGVIINTVTSVSTYSYYVIF